VEDQTIQLAVMAVPKMIILVNKKQIMITKVTKSNRHHRNRTVVAEKMEIIIEVIIPMVNKCDAAAIVITGVPEMHVKLMILEISEVLAEVIETNNETVIDKQPNIPLAAINATTTKMVNKLTAEDAARPETEIVVKTSNEMLVTASNSEENVVNIKANEEMTAVMLADKKGQLNKVKAK